MYSVVLITHSYLRWLLIVVAAISLGLSVAGWLKRQTWSVVNERLHTAFIACLDLQFLLGLILYFALSPISAAFLHSPGTAIKDPVFRFYGLEHAVTMFAAVAVGHIGRRRSKRHANEPALRHRTVVIAYLIWFVLVLIASPWPGQPYGRPLFR